MYIKMVTISIPPGPGERTPGYRRPERKPKRRIIGVILPITIVVAIVLALAVACAPKQVLASPYEPAQHTTPLVTIIKVSATYDMLHNTPEIPVAKLQVIEKIDPNPVPAVEVPKETPVSANLTEATTSTEPVVVNLIEKEVVPEINFDNLSKEELIHVMTTVPTTPYAVPDFTVENPLILENIPMPVEHQEYVNYMAIKYNLPVSFLLSQIHQENHDWSNDAVSATNDYGYPQINSENLEWLHDELGITNIRDPYQNLECQAFILRDILDRHPIDNWHTLAMSYNMGYSNMKKQAAKGTYSSEYSRELVAYADNVFGGLPDINNYK